MINAQELGVHEDVWVTKKRYEKKSTKGMMCLGLASISSVFLVFIMVIMGVEEQTVLDYTGVIAYSYVGLSFSLMTYSLYQEHKSKKEVTCILEDNNIDGTKAELMQKYKPEQLKREIIMNTLGDMDLETLSKMVNDYQSKG